jgi:hypothetical protein
MMIIITNSNFKSSGMVVQLEEFLLARMNVQHGHAGLALDLAAPDEAAETAFDMSDHLRRENQPKNFEFLKKCEKRLCDSIDRRVN